MTTRHNAQWTKGSVYLLICLLFLSLKGISQSDTLHIYYKGLEVRVLDSNETKIGNWAKSLNGKKVDVEVIAWYNDASLKKYSQGRCDELYITLNRKARNLINIKSIEPKKGAKSQRTVADIIYTVQGSAPVAEEKEKKKENTAGKAATGAAVAGAAAAGEPAKSEKAPKEEKKAKKESTKEPAADHASETAVEPAAEKPAKAEKAAKEGKPAKASKYDYIMDTTYVNGVMKVTKRKVKK